MKSSFLYKFGKYPNNNEVVLGVIEAAERLSKKVEKLNINKLSISEYNKRYFGGHIKNKQARLLNLTKYAYVLSWALNKVDKPKEKITFLDHGGGHGMLSLLAKEYGIGTVIHEDIYPVSCEDAKKIATELNLLADHYIPGDIYHLMKYFKDKNINCDCIANYDVIEHIYEIDDFLSKLNSLSSNDISIFFATSANGLNPRINFKLKKMHRYFETKNRKYRFGRKPTDTTKALLDLRKEIILKVAPKLSGDEISKLSNLTRGLIKPEIEKAVKNYCKNHELPKPIPHPTNTCDPFTGNWFEHIMNPFDLSNSLKKYGFESDVLCGFYDQPPNIFKKIVKLTLNIIIRLAGKFGLYFAPYYALCARSKKKNA